MFNEITVSLFKMIEHNSKESMHLKEARDSLLPKLLSGELFVEATEVEAVELTGPAEYGKRDCMEFRR